MKGLVTRIAAAAMSRTARLLSGPQLAAALARIAVARARRLPPADGLRLLFGIDETLYRAEGKLATAYDNGVHTKHRHLGYHDFFIDRVAAGERVLDVGCGIGAVAHDLAERAGAAVVGVDFNPESIDQARRLHGHPRVEYRLGDVCRDVPREHFDVVVLSNVLEHLTERPAVLRRIVEAAAPDRLLVRVPCFDRDWRVPLRRELGVEWRLDLTHETEYTLQAFEEEVRAAGLAVRHLQVNWGEIWAELVPDASQD